MNRLKSCTKTIRTPFLKIHIHIHQIAYPITAMQTQIR